MQLEALENLISENTYNDVTQAMKNTREKLRNEVLNMTSDSYFNKVYIYENFITDEMCIWIVNESELFALDNGGWTTNRHRNYPTTDLPIRYIPNLNIPIENLLIRNILPLIAEKYHLNSYFLNVGDIFIVKYTAHEQNELTFHKDGSLVSFNILLSDKFEGGGTCIKHICLDGSTKDVVYTTKKKDLLIHCGRLLHAGRKITEGTRYLLVGFIEYCSFKARPLKN